MLPAKHTPAPKALPLKEKKYQFKSSRAASGWQPNVVQGAERLIELAMAGDPDVFDMWLAEEAKLRPDIINFQEEKNGCVPLHVAASRGNLGLIALMLRRRAGVNVQDFFGNTALHYAIDKGHTEAAKLLIKNGANVQQADFRGNTPLHLASSTENLELLDLLVARGADTQAVNHSNQKPIDVTSYPVVQRKLEKAAQAKMDGTDPSGKDQIINWMGFGIGLGVGLGMAMAKQQQLSEQHAKEAKELDDRRQRAILAAAGNQIANHSRPVSKAGALAGGGTAPAAHGGALVSVGGGGGVEAGRISSNSSIASVSTTSQSPKKPI